MARARSPNRDKAYKLWKASNGSKPLKDIAAELGVTDMQVRKWKNQDKWSMEGNGNVTNQAKRNVPKKKGNVTNKNSVPISAAVMAVFSAPENEELTEKESLFCRFFVNNRNATQAAIKAGYSVNTAGVIGYENLNKPHIRAEVERLKAIRNQAIMLSEDDIVERYMRIAFADMTDFSEFGIEDVPVVDAEGKPVINDDGSMMVEKRNYLNFKDHSQVDGGLICEISVGKQGMKVKLEDRQKALDWLANYFGMNPMHKHKVWFDKQKLEFEQKRIAIFERKAGEVDTGKDDGADNFKEALMGKVPEVWGDGS